MDAYHLGANARRKACTHNTMPSAVSDHKARRESLAALWPGCGEYPNRYPNAAVPHGLLNC